MTGTSWTSLSQELPPGWTIARNRPHPRIVAVSRPSPTAVHVVVAREHAELIEKIRAATGRAGQVKLTA
jgi:hypothetical protein